MKFVQLLKRSVTLLMLLIFVSCYDYGFKEVHVKGQVYLVLAEDVPEHYTLKFKESATNYRSLVTEKILVIEDSGDKLYVATAQIPPQFFKIDPTNPDLVESISESEFVGYWKAQEKPSYVTIPQP